MTTPYNWNTGPIGPGWLIMIAPVAKYSGGSGFSILPGTTESPADLKKKRRRNSQKKRDAELVAMLLLTEDLL